MSWSSRSIRGRVAGQHVHGFLRVCRSAETEQNTWYSNGTKKNETPKRKRRFALQAGTHLHNHDAR